MEMVDAAYGVENHCNGFGPTIDTDKTPENVKRWEGAVQACSRWAITGCSDCRTPEFLRNIKEGSRPLEG
jgi:hypothetical protein